MANVVVYAPSLINSGQHLRDVLEDLGHTVTLITVQTGPGSPSGFDLLVTQHGAGGGGISAGQITAWLDADKGVLVVDSSNGTGRGVGLTSNHVILLLGLANTHSRERYYTELTGVDVDHEITVGLSDPLEYLNSGETTHGVLDLPLANESGEVLANGDSGNASLEAGAAIAIFDVGLLYTKVGVPTPLTSRVAYLGAGAPTEGNGDPTGYSADGITLLDRLVTWILAAPARPAQPVITLGDVTNSDVGGSLSAYFHADSVPVGTRYIWLERADGSYIVDPGLVNPEVDDTFVFINVVEDGFIGAQDFDENGDYSVKAARVAYALEDGDTEVDEEAEEGGSGDSFESLNMWAWPTAKVNVTFNTEPPAAYSALYYLMGLLYEGATLLSSKAALPANPTAGFAWLKPGHIYTLKSGWKYRLGSDFPITTRAVSFAAPLAFVSPRFDLRHGALVRGATFSLEWYESPDCLLVPGDDRVELTYDGIVFIPITTLNFATNEVSGRVTYELDSTVLTDGRARFSVVRETDGGDALRRYSPVVFIDNAELCTRIEGVDLLLSAFDIQGGVDEADYWTEDEYDGEPILKRDGPANTAGRLILDVDTPRGFGVVAEGMFAAGGDTDLGALNGLQYLPDTECAWGVSGYVTTARKMLEARFRGLGAAVGTAYNVFHGAVSYNWELGNVYGRGTGELEIATHNGSDTVFVQRASAGKRQYNRVLPSAGRWWQETPWYGVEGFYQQASVTPQALLLQASLHGGETEDEFAPVIEYAALDLGYPCGDPAVCVLSLERDTVFYLRSFTVYPITYGDCAIDAPEPPPPGSISLPLEKAWAFPLDGHVFYVLNLMEENKTFVFDALTGQWAHWFTRAQPFWNMFRGFTWRGRTVAADFASAKVWELEPTSLLDEEAYQITRTVSGFMAVRGKQSFRQGDMRLTTSVGAPTQEEATLRVRFSDDGGNSWSDYFDRVLVSGDFTQVLKYRSLGRLRAPGRLWEITDTGATVRIDGADAVMDEP